MADLREEMMYAIRSVDRAAFISVELAFEIADAILDHVTDPHGLGMKIMDEPDPKMLSAHHRHDVAWEDAPRYPGAEER